MYNPTHYHWLAETYREERRQEAARQRLLTEAARATQVSHKPIFAKASLGRLATLFLYRLRHQVS